MESNSSLFACLFVLCLLLSPFLLLLQEFACDSYEFACASGDQCVNSGYQCDGVFDCRDHSDERDCRKLAALTYLYIGTEYIMSEIYYIII